MTSAGTGRAMVVGASRGLGLAIARELLSRGWHVVATQRSPEGTGLRDAAEAAGDLLEIETLDVVDHASVASLRTRLSHSSLDLLFVVAGVANGPEDRVDRISDEKFIQTMTTNALGPMRVIAALEDRVSPDGTIAAMSSSLGSVSLNERGTWEVYRASKAALNTLMRSYAARQTGSHRSLALVDPGFVKTDMGGSGATLSIDESVPGIVDALMARSGKPSLEYFNYKGETIPW